MLVQKNVYIILNGCIQIHKDVSKTSKLGGGIRRGKSISDLLYKGKLFGEDFSKNKGKYEKMYVN